MRKGLLAQWRGRIVGRGVAAAALLSLPVAVAAVIGFSEGLGGVVRGFDALDGPEPAAAGATAGPDDGLDTALVALVGDEDPGPGDRDGGSGPDGTDPDAPDGPGAPPAPGTDPPVNVPGTLPLTAPVEDPSGSVDSLVDDVNRTVDGLLGNR